MLVRKEGFRGGSGSGQGRCVVYTIHHMPHLLLYKIAQLLDDF